MKETSIIVEALIQCSATEAWHYYVSPEHIIHWNFASPEWHCPKADNALEEGGELNYVMAARDGSMSFEFKGIFNSIEEPLKLDYTLGDGRKVKVNLQPTDQGTRFVQSFEPEQENSLDLQRDGWQAILNNFKEYVEKVRTIVNQ